MFFSRKSREQPVSSLGLRTSQGLLLYPQSAGATAFFSSLSNLPIIPGLSGSLFLATRVTLGNIALSNSSRFPVKSGPIPGQTRDIAARSREAGDPVGLGRVASLADLAAISRGCPKCPRIDRKTARAAQGNIAQGNASSLYSRPGQSWNDTKIQGGTDCGASIGDQVAIPRCAES